MASPPIPPSGSLQFKLVKMFVDLNVRVYRLTGGRLGGKVKGAPVLLLDQLGVRVDAGARPVLYLRDGADLVIVGSRGGSDAMPAWFLNLMSSPSTAEASRRRGNDSFARVHENSADRQARTEEAAEGLLATHRRYESDKLKSSAGSSPREPLRL
jgi:hypothetical protein